MNDRWQDRIPEELIEQLAKDEELVQFTDEWRALSEFDQLVYARAWLRAALGLEEWR